MRGMRNGIASVHVFRHSIIELASRTQSKVLVFLTQKGGGYVSQPLKNFAKLYKVKI